MSANLTRARQLLQFSRYEEAERMARQAVQENPEDPDSQIVLARSLVEQKGKRKEAVEAAKQAVGLAPDWSYPHSVLATVLTLADREKEALPHAEEALRLDPEVPDYYFQVGWLHSHFKKWEIALGFAEKGLAISAEDVTGNNLRAHCLRNLKRTDEAGVTLDAALQRDPENAFTHSNMGWAKLQAGDHGEALKHFKEALRLDPNNEYARDGIIEALKARFPIYRLILKYIFFMSRQTQKMQWVIIIGGLIGFRIVRAMAASNPSTAFLVPWIIGAWCVLVIASWAGSLLFDIALFAHPIGKNALSGQRQTAAALGGLAVILSICSVLIHAATGEGPQLLFAAALFLASLLPLSTLSYLSKKGNLLIAGSVALGVSLCALATIAGFFMYPERRGDIEGFTLIGIYAVAIYSWVGNFMLSSEK